MSNAAVYSFERLLTGGASLDQIDEFLHDLSSARETSDTVKEGLGHFSSQGDLRGQGPFLLDLCKNGCFPDARAESRVAFVFNGMLAPVTFAAVRARLQIAGRAKTYRSDLAKLHP